jgi:hypothetical protein
MTVQKTAKTTEKQAVVANLKKLRKNSLWHPEEFFRTGTEFTDLLKKGSMIMILHRYTAGNSAACSFRARADNSDNSHRGPHLLNYTFFVKTLLCVRSERDGDKIFINKDIDDELNRMLVSYLHMFGFLTEEERIELTNANMLLIAR